MRPKFLWMMMLGSLLLGLLLSACSAGAVERPGAGSGAGTLPAADSGGPALTLRRSGGMAGLVEEWRIYPDGRLEAQEGQSTPVVSNLPAQEVAALLSWIEQSGFLSAVVPTLSADDTCCDRYVYELTAVLDVGSNTIRVVDTPEYLPPNLAEAFRRVAMLIEMR